MHPPLMNEYINVRWVSFYTYSVVSQCDQTVLETHLPNGISLATHKRVSNGVFFHKFLMQPIKVCTFAVVALHMILSLQFVVSRQTMKEVYHHDSR